MKAVKRVEVSVASGEAGESLPGFGVGVGGVVDPRLLAALGAINAASVVPKGTHSCRWPLFYFTRQDK